MRTRDGKTPAWLIERLALGELDAATAASVRQRLLDEGRSPEAEIAALAASNREVLQAHPAAGVAAAVRERAPRRRRAPWILFGAPLLAGAAAAVLVMVRPPAPGAGGGALEETTNKGPAQLYVYRHGNSGDERLRDGDPAARGDLVQLAYRCGTTDRFGALISIDGAGRVTVHWPRGGEAGPLSCKGRVPLPAAYELDDAPAFERFFLITADAPFPMSSVLDAARMLAARPADARLQTLALPSSLRQKFLTLNKTLEETP